MLSFGKLRKHVLSFFQFSNIFARKLIAEYFLSEYDLVWSVDLNTREFFLSEYDMTSVQGANKHEFFFKRIRLGCKAEIQ